MSLWSSLSVGVGGLQTSQNALNTVAHNLTNVDTEGYTRQQIEQADRSYVTLSKTGSAISYQQIGLGVYYSNVKQVRDYFLDKTYRQEAGRESFYEVSKNTIEEVQDLFGELNRSPFQESVTDLWTAVQELTKDPCNSVTQGALVNTAAEMLARAQSIYDDLSSYQDNLNLQIKQQVDQINKYGKQILELNDQIRKIEMGGIERANDLRDTRNQILDDLSKMVNISYAEDTFGNVSVQIEGEDFVKGSLCFEIGLHIDNTTDFYTPFWPQNAEYTLNERGEKDYQIDNALVFKEGQVISSDYNTDIGGLKAMVLARGDHRANYTDIENDYEAVSDSILMNVQAEFDQLMHNLMTAVNGVLADAAGVQKVNADTVDADYAALYAQLKSRDVEDGTWYEGKEYRALKAEDADYMTDRDGSPLQLYQKNTTDGYTKVTVGDEKSSVVFWVYNEEDAADDDSLYTAHNSRVNQNLLQTPTLLGFRLKDKSEDRETMDKLKKVFTAEEYNLNPNVLKKVNLVDYYGDLISQVSNSGYVYRSIYDTQEQTVNATKSARDQITAVSSDEELSAMIRYQSAYNASSRFINVVNEMLEHLLVSLA